MNIRTTLIASSLIAASLASILASGAAHAALEGRDLNGSIGSFEAYYDTDLDITWLANANVNGYMTWADANTWAANLSFTDGINTYNNWRLPTTLQPDPSCQLQTYGTSWGHSCSGSEMGHLFYVELGGTKGQPILTSADPDLAKFNNLGLGLHWSETGYLTPYTTAAWSFDTGALHQTGYAKEAIMLALAVSPGDVGAVPEAESWAMLLAGLGLVGAATRRRRG